MLKEEKELMNWIKGIAPHFYSMKHGLNLFASFKKALIRAVEERCAKKCDEQAAFYRSLREKGPSGMVDADTARAIAADDCAAAIRKGRRG